MLKAPTSSYTLYFTWRTPQDFCCKHAAVVVSQTQSPLHHLASCPATASATQPAHVLVGDT